MHAPVDTFSSSYAEARAKFAAAAEAAGLDVESHVHPLRGRDDEELAMDVVRHGPRHSERLLIISSGCHGVEGYCGSGAQIALLRDTGWQAAVRAAGVAVLYIHALNPYGFSWLRRVTQENVDLNRNFQDFSKPLPANPGYDEIAHLLLPPNWPPSPEVREQIGAHIARRGMPALQAAVSGGQYNHPEGLYYGGVNPTWSNVTLRHILQEHGAGARRLGWIDLHTGLGPKGHGERIFACRNDAEALGRARSWWGPEVTSIYDGSSSSALLTGLMWTAAYDEIPQAQYTGIVLEFGTLPVMDVLEALRAEHWLENHPEAPAEQARQIKQQMLTAFYADEPEWKRQVVEHSLEVAEQTLKGLSRPDSE